MKAVTIVAVAVLFVLGSAHAAIYTVGSTQGTPGSTVSVPIILTQDDAENGTNGILLISSNNPTGAIPADADGDGKPDIVRGSGAEATRHDISGAYFDLDEDGTSETTSLVIFSFEGLKITGEIAIISFVISTAANTGTVITLSCSHEQLYDNDVNAVPVTTTSGSITVVEPVARMDVNPAEGTIELGDITATTTLTITMINIGDEGSTLNWTAEVTGDGISVSPENGSLAQNESTTLTVTVDQSGLEPGDYAAIVNIAGIDSASSNVVSTAEYTITFTIPTSPAPPSGGGGGGGGCFIGVVK